MKKTLNLVKDSLFCAIVSVIIIISNSFAILSNILFSFFLVVFFACYFQNKKLIRSVMSSIIVIAISLLIINPLDVFIFILPGLILGVLASLYLEKFAKFKLFYIILSVVFFLVNILIEFLYAKLFMNMDFIQYIMDDEIFHLTNNTKQFTIVFVAVYFILVALISFMETLILKNSNILYKKRIVKILGEEEKRNI